MARVARHEAVNSPPSGTSQFSQPPPERVCPTADGVRDATAGWPGMPQDDRRSMPVPNASVSSLLSVLRSETPGEPGAPLSHLTNGSCDTRAWLVRPETSCAMLPALREPSRRTKSLEAI